MKSVTGLRDMVMAVLAGVFSFIGADPVSSGVCASGRMTGNSGTP
jgi:hypothetical protein